MPSRQRRITMPRRYDDELEDAPEEDREISLGAASILGIFFLLVLICAACFGFGYSMRGRQTSSAAVATTPASLPPGDNQAKPSPASAESAPPPTSAGTTTPAETTQPALASESQPETPASEPPLTPVSLSHASTSAP